MQETRNTNLSEFLLLPVLRLEENGRSHWEIISHILKLNLHVSSCCQMEFIILGIWRFCINRSTSLDVNRNKKKARLREINTIFVVFPMNELILEKLPAVYHFKLRFARNVLFISMFLKLDKPLEIKNSCWNILLKCTLICIPVRSVQMFFLSKLPSFLASYQNL